MSIKEISQLRFDAYAAYTRRPIAFFISEEIAWYADDDENFLGVIIRDTEDNDFLYIILARDQNGRFRCIFPSFSFEEMDEAKNELMGKLTLYEKSNQKIFPQGDKKRNLSDIFKPTEPRERLNRSFLELVENKGYSPAYEIIKELSNHFLNPDGNFIQQFQTDGFDARIWELYLYAVFTECGFIIDRQYCVPDFTLISQMGNMCVEAVTVNPTMVNSDMGQLKQPKSQQEMERILLEYMPIKFGSPLFSKLNKCYWNLPNVKGTPLIFAIEDFHLPGSMLWSSSALETYLYGLRHSWEFDEKGALIITPKSITEHKHGEKVIPSGFFFQENAENVSAVLFSNSGTISNFNRMGYVAGFGARDIEMVRVGTRYDHSPNASEPKNFIKNVNDSDYSETWSEGISIFHNPNALNPVLPDLFPNMAHHFFDNGKLRSFLPDFHPYASITKILCSDT